MRVYADNAATTELSRKALDAMLPYLGGEFANPSALYEEGRKVREAVDDARNREERISGAAAEKQSSHQEEARLILRLSLLQLRLERSVVKSI